MAAIYAHHVLNGTATFDEIPPSEDFWAEKIIRITENGWPFLVAVKERWVCGYAYATQFRDRPAYAHTCEDSIYLHPDHLGQGIGKWLLSHLIDASASADFRQMIAVIGGAEPASVAVHAACGFREAGRMKSVGFKFGQWLDTLYMQCALAN